MWSFHDLRYGLVSQSLIHGTCPRFTIFTCCMVFKTMFYDRIDLSTRVPESTMQYIQFTIYYSRYTISDLPSAICNPQFSIRETRYAIHVPPSVIHDPRSTIHDPWSVIPIYNKSISDWIVSSFSYSLPTICSFWLWACRTPPSRRSSLHLLPCTLGLVM